MLAKDLFPIERAALVDAVDLLAELRELALGRLAITTAENI